MAAYLADHVQEHEEVEARKKDKPEDSVVYPGFEQRNVQIVILITPAEEDVP
ncbi:hypothetical protein D3C87_2106170 [compost metagenome]